MFTEEIKKQRFDKDCRILVDGILKAFEIEPEAILLCGGYGRGEGAWYEDEDGKPTPYNDYDVAVITERPLSRDKYIILRKELASKIGINWVDIDCYSQAQLSRMLATIHNVDLFKASTLLWGNKNWNKGRTLESRRIGDSDITRLYTTRMWTFLGPVTEQEQDLNVADSRFFRNQMAKAVLAGCDMRLVAKHLYTTSYQERVNIVCNNLLDDVGFKELCKWAICEKLTPSSIQMNALEVKELYNKTYQFFIDSFGYAMGWKAKYYLTPTRTKVYQLLCTSCIPLIMYNRLRGNNAVWKSFEIMRAQNYVFRAYSTTGDYNKRYLTLASDILIKYNYISEPILNWRKACSVVAKARNNV